MIPLVVGAAVVALTVGVGPAAASASPPGGSTAKSPSGGNPAGKTTTADYQPACDAAQQDVRGKLFARCFAMIHTALAGTVTADAAGPPAGAVGPAQIQDAYDLPASGQGQTVAIVDAFGDSSAEADLGVFRSQFGLPACTTDNGCFRKVDQRGGTNYPPVDPGWALETSLDLDAVSAACPACHILLVQGDDSSVDSLGTAVDTAVSLGAKFVSNSYGIAGEAPNEQDFDHYYDHPGVAVTASTGDIGNVQNWPATSPKVVGVGGTTLTRDSSPRGWHERAWADGGSGCSSYEPRPDYQTGIAPMCGDNRASADIAADADPDTGLAVYDTIPFQGESGWFQVGGTSLASPLTAAMYALAGTPVSGSYPVSYPYQAPAGSLNDVTEGSNGGCGDLMCNAGTGWDGPTGLGTPNGVSALTLGPHGNIAGTVTDASTGAALAGVTVTTDDGFKAITDPSGHYSIRLPAGTHSATFARFGYASQSQDNIQVTDGGTTTANAALRSLPAVTVSGTVTDGSGHGWPLYTRISVAGDPPGGPFFTDPITGRYSIKVPADTSLAVSFQSQLSGYQTLTQTIPVGGGDLTHDVAIPVTPDCTAPGYASGSHCAVVPGGLVEGNVVDLSNGNGINGATVASADKPADTATTSATPDDPNTPDGFYGLFSSLTGSHVFTASDARHSDGTATVSVAADAAVRQDYKLGTGRLTITPTSLSSTQVLGTTATRILSFHNDGTGPAHVKLSDTLDSHNVNPPLASPNAAHFSKPIAEPGPTSYLGNNGKPDARIAAGTPGWQPGAPLPRGLVRYAHAQCADQPSSYYVIGGVSSGALVNASFRYDTVTNTWTTLAPIPVGLEASAAACLNGRIYVMGGSGTNQMYIYDIASDTWGSGAPTPQPIEGAAAGALNGKVYLVGGDSDFRPGNGVYNTVSIYDVASNTWSSGEFMPTATGNAGYVQIGKFLYVAGGWSNGNPSLNEPVTERYDMTADAWEIGPAFTPAKADFALAATGTALYAIGGDLPNNTFTDASTTTHRLDLGDWPHGTWQNLGDPLPAPRTANSAGFCTTDITGTRLWNVAGFASGAYHNDVLYRSSGEACGADQPWLDESPADFEVPAGGTVSVTVTFSTTPAAGVTQPGTRSAQLAVTTNAGQATNSMPVTMNVTPPKNWGEITGSVNQTSCGGHTSTLRNATISATGRNYSQAARTDSNGDYAIWAPAAASAVTLVASRYGWTAQTETAKPNPGRPETVNLSLRQVCTTQQVSLANDDTEGSEASQRSVISADGRYVAFMSTAPNLVPGDTNATPGRSGMDVFVYDRHTGTIERVSVASDGSQADDDVLLDSMSANGRYVAFESLATNLVPGDPAGIDIYVHDRQTGITERVSKANDTAQLPGLYSAGWLSGDGRFVGYTFIGTGPNARTDAFVYDRQTGTTERVSVAADGTEANGNSNVTGISADGRYVGMVSTASNLVPGDTNGAQDAFIYDRETRITQRVSVATDGTQANGASFTAVPSADGRYVSYLSLANNLVPGDTNGAEDVFVFDRVTNTTQRVSVASDGTQGNGFSATQAISADGRYVSYLSLANNLVPGDTNATYDVFVYDRNTRTTQRVSVAGDGTQSNNQSFTYPGSISADGRYVAFFSYASNLTPEDGNQTIDVFVRDRNGG